MAIYQPKRIKATLCVAFILLGQILPYQLFMYTVYIDYLGKLCQSMGRLSHFVFLKAFLGLGFDLRKYCYTLVNWHYYLLINNGQIESALTISALIRQIGDIYDDFHTSAFADDSGIILSVLTWLLLTGLNIVQRILARIAKVS